MFQPPINQTKMSAINSGQRIMDILPKRGTLQAALSTHLLNKHDVTIMSFETRGLDNALDVYNKNASMMIASDTNAPAMLDSGAAVHACGHSRYEVKGTRSINATAVSTARGVYTPE